MNQRSTTYPFHKILSAIFMILALGWLTISLPFVYKALQYASEISQPNDINESKTNNNYNPLSNTTEEKTPDQVQEYLHGQHENLELLTANLNHLHTHESKVYIAYHGELLCPPPNA